MALLTRKQLLLAKIESSSGTDAVPTVGSNAVLLRSVDVTPLDSGTAARDKISPYLQNTEQLLTDTKVLISMEIEMSGSGASGTASRIDPLLRACGFAASTTGSAVTGSSQAGSAGSITLASGANSNDNYYNGMVITITSGTGNGHKGLIVDYNGTTKVATVKASTTAFTPGSSSGYSISANVNYKPVSSSFESTTIYFFNGSTILHKAVGCRGTFSLSIETSGIPVFSFEMTGIYVAPTDTTPGAATFANQSAPLVAKAGNTVATSILGYDSANVQSISFDVANEIIFRQLIGSDKEVLIANREPSGEAVIELPTIAQKDYFTIANSDSSTDLVCFQHGTTAGNIVSLVAPKVDLINPTLADQDGIQHITLPLTYLPESGNDEVVLTFQ